MYQTLRLDQCQGLASKWVYRNQAKFISRLQVLGKGALIHGNMSDHLGQIFPEDKCLVATSVSVAGLVLLLGQWSAAQVYSGGFRDDAH